MPDLDPKAGLFAALLKHWRTQRGLSQLDLALAADVSSRHVSFLETGRSRPTAEMVHRLVAVMGVPLRHVDVMLEAAGHPRAYGAPTGPLPAPVVAALEVMKAHHEPNPLLVVDRVYDVVDANHGASRLLTMLLAGRAPPFNLARLTFDPAGAHPHIVNFDALGRELLWRIQREALADPADEGVRSLLDDLLAMPTVSPDWRRADLSVPAEPALVVHLRHDGRDLRFLTTVTSFQAPQNVMVEELRVETWFPVDDATRATMATMATMATQR